MYFSVSFGFLLVHLPTDWEDLHLRYLLCWMVSLTKTRLKSYLL